RRLLRRQGRGPHAQPRHDPLNTGQPTKDRAFPCPPPQLDHYGTTFSKQNRADQGFPAGVAARPTPFCSPRAQLSLTIQPWVSSLVPRCIPVSRSRSFMVTSPAWPSAMVNSPDRCLTRPTGVMTAAVPHAKTSVSSPLAAFFSHSSTVMRRSSTCRPNSEPSSSREDRVTPGSRLPLSSGVTSLASAPE